LFLEAYLGHEALTASRELAMGCSTFPELEIQAPRFKTSKEETTMTAITSETNPT